MKKNYNELSPLDKIKDLEQSYKEMSENIFSGVWCGDEWWMFRIINTNKIRAHQYRGIYEGLKTAREIMEGENHSE